jgi:hypothetical protein
MSTDTRPRAGAPSPAGADEGARPREEPADVQRAVIEMLHVQVAEQRARLDRQAAEIVELRRLLQVRDELLAVRATPAPGTVRGTLFGVLRRVARALVGRS